ncbi:hypothetical protein ABZ942_33065 [Nocardia sp. NPDC046473]|uniref:hypothetical protein n=1 Tax=Nocardia sp. NPDC046473 TaxID=3155733 RepID=UPI0033E52D46
MRKTILASVVLATVMGGYTLMTAGTATAMDKAASCAAVVDVTTKFNDQMGALDKSDPNFEGNRKGVIDNFSDRLTGVAATTDDSELKSTITRAAEKSRQLGTVSNDEYNKIVQDKNSDFVTAATELNNACPLP